MAQADGGAGVPSGDPSSWFQDETPAAAPAPSAASGPSSWFEDPLPASVQPAQAPDSTASTLLRNLKQGARDVDEAAGGIVSAPYSIGNALGWAIDKLGGPKQDLTPLEPLNTFAGPEAIQNDLSRAGLPPQPLTPNEQTAHAGITAGLEAAPFGPVQSAAGAVGGALGEKLLSELPPDTEPWKKALIGGLTGFGTGVLAAGGEAMRATTKAFTAAQQDVARQQALLDQRIEEHSAAQADKAQWQKKNQGLEHPTEPGVTETVFDAAKRAHAEAVQHAQDTADALTAQIASGLGPKQSPPALGKLVQGAVTDWSKNGMRQQIDDLEAPLAAKVPGDAEVEHGPLLRKLEELQGHHAGELAGPAEALFPASVQPLIDRFLAKFAGDEGGDMEELPESAKFSWDDAKRFRSELGNAMHDPKTARNLGSGNLEALYNVATEQMRDTAIEHEAGDEFNAYNRGTTDLYDLKNRYLSNIENDGSRLPEDSVGALERSLKNNGSLVPALRAVNPSVADQFAAHFLHREGIKGWQALEPEAKEALVPDANVRLGLEIAAEGQQRAIDSSARARNLIRLRYVNEGRQVSSAVSGANTLLHNAKSRFSAAQRALAATPQPPQVNSLIPKMGSLAEGSLGTLAGKALSGELGFHNGALIGGAIGLLEHPARQALHGLISRPALTARGVGTGAAVGNALLNPDFSPKGK